MAELDIEFRGVEKSFGSLKAVKDINLKVEKGEFHSFLGASGCGKTTTLQMIAGLILERGLQIFRLLQRLTEFAGRLLCFSFQMHDAVVQVALGEPVLINEGRM